MLEGLRELWPFGRWQKSRVDPDYPAAIGRGPVHRKGRCCELAKNAYTQDRYHAPHWTKVGVFCPTHGFAQD